MKNISTDEQFLKFLTIKQNTLETTSNRNKNDQIKPNPIQQRNPRELKTLTVTTGTYINCRNPQLFQNCQEFFKLNASRETSLSASRVCIKTFF